MRENQEDLSLDGRPAFAEHDEETEECPLLKPDSGGELRIVGPAYGKEAEIRYAYETAKMWAPRILGLFRGIQAGTADDRVTRAFHFYFGDSPDWSQIIQVATDIRDGLNDDVVQAKVYRSCRAGHNASANSRYLMFCPRYFAAHNAYQKGAIFYHELTHHFGGTIDVTYNASEYASLTPQQRANNAECYEDFFLMAMSNWPRIKNN